MVYQPLDRKWFNFIAGPQQRFRNRQTLSYNNTRPTTHTTERLNTPAGHKLWNKLYISRQPNEIHKLSYRNLTLRILEQQTSFSASLDVIEQSRSIPTTNPLDINGVIYAIIYIPSHKIYIGQTINSAYARFSQHWNTRFNNDGKNDLLHKLMCKTTRSNFIVWPLEKIPEVLYMRDAECRHNKFREVASVRELYWINLLKTMNPTGFNVKNPVRKAKNRRNRRPNRWENRNFNEHLSVPCNECIQITDDTIEVHNHPGPHAHTRSTLSRYINILKNQNQQQLLQYIKQKSLSHNIAIRNFILNHKQHHNISHILLDDTQRVLNDYLNHRTNPPAIDEIPFTNFVKIEHMNRIMQLINIPHILHSPNIKSLLPADIDPPRLCNKQVSPIRTWVTNFTKTAKRAASIDYPQLLPAAQCLCRRTFPNAPATSLRDGHICTTDFSFLPVPNVRSLLDMGCKYREDHSKETVFTAIEDGLSEYIQKIREKRNSTAETIVKLNIWKTAVLHACRALIAQCNDLLDNTSLNSDKKYIRYLQNNFTISPGDKLSHNFVMTCTPYYINILRNELFTSPVYETPETTYDEILAHHKAINTHCGYRHIDRLPYLYSIPKMHKIGNRFIAGVSQYTNNNNNVANNTVNVGKSGAVCSTTNLSKFLSKQFNIIIDILRRKDQTDFITLGYRKFFIIQKADEIFSTIKSQPEAFAGKHPRTFDFTTMYTNLKHTDILLNIAKAIDIAHTFTGIQSGMSSKEVLMFQLTFLIKNTFICNDRSSLRRQKVGLPMGTNCAPEIANLVLYVWEAEFMDTLYAQNTEQAKQLLRAHSDTRRYIDDLLCFDTAAPPLEAYHGLQYTEQTAPDGSVTYLGAKIYLSTSNRLCLEVFDKTIEWDFKVLRYPHALSNAPLHQTTGIYIGQLQRIRIICNSYRFFKTATANLTKHMLLRGHKPQLLLRGWNLFMIHHARDTKANREELRRWFKRMIFWGICVSKGLTRPAVVRQNPAARQQPYIRVLANILIPPTPQLTLPPVLPIAPAPTIVTRSRTRNAAIPPQPPPPEPPPRPPLPIQPPPPTTTPPDTPINYPTSPYHSLYQSPYLFLPISTLSYPNTPPHIQYPASPVLTPQHTPVASSAAPSPIQHPYPTQVNNSITSSSSMSSLTSSEFLDINSPGRDQNIEQLHPAQEPLTLHTTSPCQFVNIFELDLCEEPTILSLNTEAYFANIVANEAQYRDLLGQVFLDVQRNQTRMAHSSRKNVPRFQCLHCNQQFVICAKHKEGPCILIYQLRKVVENILSNI